MERIDKILEFLKASPKDNFLRHALALEYVKTGDDAKARNWFEEILNDSPDYVGSYYHLAQLLERVGDTNAAIIVMKKECSLQKPQMMSMHIVNCRVRMKILCTNILSLGKPAVIVCCQGGAFQH